jgi:hypothetical protein
MDWGAARERLCNELIRARDTIVARWIVALRAHGLEPWCIERCADELVVQAAAALADELPPEAPWERCGGLLRVAAAAPLETELRLLWRAIGTVASHVSTSADQHQHASEILAEQLAATLRGADAALREVNTGLPASPRFGGVQLIVTSGAPSAANEHERATG